MTLSPSKVKLPNKIPLQRLHLMNPQEVDAGIVIDSKAIRVGISAQNLYENDAQTPTKNAKQILTPCTASDLRQFDCSFQYLLGWSQDLCFVKAARSISSACHFRVLMNHCRFCMEMPKPVLLIYVVIACKLAAAHLQQSSNGLKLNFYALSCPQAEDIARRTLQQNRMSDPTALPALVRVVFHDCQVEGCDASILLQSTSSMTAETVSEKNFSIRRLDYIDLIKSAIENECPDTVSCADIIVMAARDAIAMSGGPRIPIETGRRDTLYASNLNADDRLPPPTVTVDDMLDTLAEKDLDVSESVAILGAHTLGVGHCLNFMNRLDPEDTGPQMSPFFSTALKVLCQASPSSTNATFAPNDLTNFVFDNQYFKDLQAQRGLLTVDAELATDKRTKFYVDQYALNQLFFFNKFTTAFLKLTRYNVLTGMDGEIRKDCKLVNP